MKVRRLGHVVLRVRDLERAEAFYHELLGLPIAARSEPWSMTFFSLGSHHDFAVVAIGGDADSPAEHSLGLDHVAFCLGESLDDLREAKQKLATAGVELAAVDHRVTQSLYFRDPDGNAIELYVDGSDDWKRDPRAVLSESGPLEP